jgi:Tfp pilus assembly protein PilF
MIRIAVSTLILAAAVAATAPVQGAVWPATANVDPYAANALAAGRTDTAEAKLARAYARGDRSIEVLLNLAAVRLRERDPAAARDLYRQVLARPNADMETNAGTGWSHDIAQAGLSIAAR